MSVEIITKEDLNLFRIALINDFRQLLTNQTQTSNQKDEWLRGFEVKKMLKISTGTLQNLRISGKLKASKVGNILYYSAAEIEQLLNLKKGV